MREEYNEALNVTKDNGAKKIIEEIDKLRQILEAKKLIHWKWLGIET